MMDHDCAAVKGSKWARVYITNWIGNKPAASKDFREKRELSMTSSRAGHKH